MEVVLMAQGQQNAHGGRKTDRRQFLAELGYLAALTGLPSAQAATRPAYFTVALHWHQAGLGLLLHQGFLRGKRYDNAYSIFNALQATIDALEKRPSLVICLDFDSYAYEAIVAEDPGFVRDTLKPYVDSGRIDIVGGTYSQPYPEIIGWESNVRQFVEGRAVINNLFGKRVGCFLTEEIAFHPQMPQLLKLCGYTSASLEVQNSGEVRKINKSVVAWRGLDGTEIPTIPPNDLMISLTKQYVPFDDLISRSAAYQEPLMTLWAEIWAPGGDWGASYIPYEKGFQSFEKAGVKPIGLNEYMRRWCSSHPHLDSEFLSLDDAKFLFDIWGGLGGWAYQGDRLLTSQRQLEHSLKAAELLVSLRPDDGASEKLHKLWNKFMVSQNHDMFVVSGFASDYNHVLTTNLEASLMIHREVQDEIGKLRKSVEDALTQGKEATQDDYLLAQNASAQEGLQPVVFEYDAAPGAGCALFDGGKEYAAQRIEPAYENAKPKFAALAPLPACSVRSFRIAKAPGQTSGGRKPSGEITNEFYRVRWDSETKAFIVEDRELGSRFLFRPFAGDIIKVKETSWESPNTGENFRAKTFSDVLFVPDAEVAGPVYSTLQVKGNILTLYTTPDPGAWVIAQAVLYHGIKRVDFRSELNTYPQMAFRAFAELETGAPDPEFYRDFPFGEEPSRKPDFTSLNYVRIQSPKLSLILAHDGTQRFFVEKRGGRTVLRNTIARETLRGDYQWCWSVTSGESLGPAESCLFAQALFPAIVDVTHAPVPPTDSLVASTDPAVVVFRFAKRPNKTTAWLANYSNQKREAILNFSDSYASVQRTDFEGKSIAGSLPVLAAGGRRVQVALHGWEIAALEFSNS
jgi:hypothetical protein